MPKETWKTWEEGIRIEIEILWARIRFSGESRAYCSIRGGIQCDFGKRASRKNCNCSRCSECFWQMKKQKYLNLWEKKKYTEKQYWYQR